MSKIGNSMSYEYCWIVQNGKDRGRTEKIEYDQVNIAGLFRMEKTEADRVNNTE